MEYQKPEKNLRLKAMIVRHYGTQEDFSVVSGMSETRISKVIGNRHEICRAEKALYANRLYCKIEDIF